MAPRPVHRLKVLESSQDGALVRTEFGPRRQRFEVRFGDLQPPFDVMTIGDNIYIAATRGATIRVSSHRLDRVFRVETNQIFRDSQSPLRVQETNRALVAALVVGVYEVGEGNGLETSLGDSPLEVVCGTNRCAIERASRRQRGMPGAPLED